MTELSVDYDIRIDPANVGDHHLWSFGRKTNCDGDRQRRLRGLDLRLQHDAAAHGPEATTPTTGVERPAVDDLRAARGRVEAPDLHAAAQRDGTTLDRRPLRGRRGDRPHRQPDRGAHRQRGRHQLQLPRPLAGAGATTRCAGRCATSASTTARCPRTRRSRSPSRRAWPGVRDDAAAIDLGLTSAIVDDIDLPKVGTKAGSQITWTTSNPAVVTAAGVITRPALGPARGDRDADRPPDQGPRGRHARHRDHGAGAVRRRRSPSRATPTTWR